MEELYIQVDPTKKFLCFFQGEDLIYKTPLKSLSDRSIREAMEQIAKATGVVMEGVLNGETWALHPKKKEN